MDQPADFERVAGLCRCSLSVDEAAEWAFARLNASEIDRHFERRKRDNPAFFNGTVLLMCGLMERWGGEQGGLVEGRLLRSDFKSFLFWRESGYPEAGVRDAFGSAIVVSADGQVLLVRQRPGQVNEGLTYLPGGFIDQRDVGEDGAVDIVASVRRELEEETGLQAGDVQRAGDLVLVASGAQLSIGVVLRSPHSADGLRERIGRFLNRETDPELADVIFAGADCDLRGHRVARFTQLALGEVFRRLAAGALGLGARD